MAHLKRVAVLVERQYGVKFGQAQIWRILGGRARVLGAKARTARHRARCRHGADLEAQDLAWAQKKARLEDRLIVFIDELGLSERPTRVRTWEPKGKTPIVQFHFNWTHISVSAWLSCTNFMFRLHQGSIKKEQHVEFRRALRVPLKQPLLIIRDRLKAHRSKLVRGSLDSTHEEMQMAFLPPYAPDLNPALSKAEVRAAVDYMVAGSKYAPEPAKLQKFR